MHLEYRRIQKLEEGVRATGNGGTGSREPLIVLEIEL